MKNVDFFYYNEIALIMEALKPALYHGTNGNKSIFHLVLDHLLALLLAFIGYVIIVLIGPPLNYTQFLIFLPLIALSTWNGGITAGTLTSAAAALFMNYFFSPAANVFTFPDFPRFIQMVLLITEGLFISYIIQSLMSQEKLRDYKRRELELKRKIADLEGRIRDYEKEIRTRDEFLSIASHELKTPLTSMLLQTQTALHNIRNVSVARFSFDNLSKMLESVENQTKRLSKMINDLLAVSVVTIGNLNLEIEEIDLNTLVKNVLTDFSARIEKEKYEVTFTQNDKIVGNWDKIRLEQAISNFVSNAIKYGQQKPIEIKTRLHHGFAEFSIKDHGIGVSKQKQKIIFELFQRAVSPEQYKGLGVGLYITQKIINSHGGNISLSSSPDKGSIFTMRLPLKNPEPIRV
jgi:signal transduction histidine kinase